MMRSWKRFRFLSAASKDCYFTQSHYKAQREWSIKNGFTDEEGKITAAGLTELDRYRYDAVVPAVGRRCGKRPSGRYIIRMQQAE